MGGITKEWLEEQIGQLEALGGDAIVRLAEAERHYKSAEEDFYKAKDELESLHACRKEWQRQLESMRNDLLL